MARWRGAGSEWRRPAESADTVSLKHKGDSWRREDQGREGRKLQREKDRDSFLCLPHCLPARSLPLSPHLAVLPLTRSQRPLSFSVSFVALPPSHSPFTFLCLAGIYLEVINPPSLPSTYSLATFPSITPPSRSFSPLLSKWLLWKQFIWKWREGNYSGAFVHFDSAACTRAAHAPV